MIYTFNTRSQLPEFDDWLQCYMAEIIGFLFTLTLAQEGTHQCCKIAIVLATLILKRSHS